MMSSVSSGATSNPEFDLVVVNSEAYRYADYSGPLAIQAVASGCRKLERVTIRGYNIDETLTPLGTFCHRLQHLDIINCWEITSVVMKEFIDQLYSSSNRDKELRL